jgi:hypothetical protein
MTDILIRDIDTAQLAAMDAHAAAAGQSRQEWAKAVLYAATAGPVIKARYTLRGYGENAAFVNIRRDEISKGSTAHAQDLSEAQWAAYRQARDLVQENAPGNRERAIIVLQDAGFDVRELP